MQINMTFKNALIMSLLSHLALAILITFSPSHKPETIINATLVSENKRDDSHLSQQPPNLIKAISLDTAEVEKAVSQLKSEKVQVEKERQEKIAKEKRAAQIAKQKRIEEQKRLAALKKEALKQAAQQRQEKLKIAALQKEHEKLLILQKEAESKRRLEQEKRAKAAKEAEIRRKEALKAKKAAAAKQAQINQVLNDYKALIVKAISDKWILPANASSQLSCEFRIRLAPDGTVVLTQLTKSSGNPVLDRSAEIAINKASPLPVPQENNLFELFRDINLTVRPEQARG